MSFHSNNQVRRKDLIKPLLSTADISCVQNYRFINVSISDNIIHRKILDFLPRLGFRQGKNKVLQEPVLPRIHIPKKIRKAQQFRRSRRKPKGRNLRFFTLLWVFLKKICLQAAEKLTAVLFPDLHGHRKSMCALP